VVGYDRRRPRVDWELRPEGRWSGVAPHPPTFRPPVALAGVAIGLLGPRRESVLCGAREGSLGLEGLCGGVAVLLGLIGAGGEPFAEFVLSGGRRSVCGGVKPRSGRLWLCTSRLRDSGHLWLCPCHFRNIAAGRRACILGNTSAGSSSMRHSSSSRRRPGICALGAGGCRRSSTPTRAATRSE
jgi:hypothetical protein